MLVYLNEFLKKLSPEKSVDWVKRSTSKLDDIADWFSDFFAKYGNTSE